MTGSTAKRELTICVLLTACAVTLCTCTILSSPLITGTAQNASTTPPGVTTGLANVTVTSLDSLTSNTTQVTPKSGDVTSVHSNNQTVSDSSGAELTSVVNTLQQSSARNVTSDSADVTSVHSNNQTVSDSSGGELTSVVNTLQQRSARNVTSDSADVPSSDSSEQTSVANAHQHTSAKTVTSGRGGVNSSHDPSPIADTVQGNYSSRPDSASISSHKASDNVRGFAIQQNAADAKHTLGTIGTQNSVTLSAEELSRCFATNGTVTLADRVIAVSFDNMHIIHRNKDPPLDKTERHQHETNRDTDNDFDAEREPGSLRDSPKPQSEDVEREPGSLRDNPKPQSEDAEREPGSLRDNPKPQSEDAEREPGSLRDNPKPQSEDVEREPGSLRDNPKPQSEDAEREPGSLRDNPKPQSEDAEREPGSLRDNPKPQSEDAERATGQLSSRSPDSNNGGGPSWNSPNNTPQEPSPTQARKKVEDKDVQPDKSASNAVQGNIPADIEPKAAKSSVSDSAGFNVPMSEDDSYSVTIGSTCSLVITLLGQSDIALVDVPEVGVSVCVGGRKVLNAADGLRNISRLCKDASLLVSGGQERGVSVTMDIKKGRGQLGWLSLTVHGDFLVGLDAPGAAAGSVQPSPPGPTDLGASERWAVLRVPPRQRAMVSVQQRFQGVPYPARCTGPGAPPPLPFTVRYGNVSSLPDLFQLENHEVTAIDQTTPPKDGSFAQMDPTARPQNGSFAPGLDITSTAPTLNVTVADTVIRRNRLQELQCNDGDELSPVSVVPGNVLVLRFSPKRRRDRKVTGQQQIPLSAELRFSFHATPEVPVKTSPGKWDCSVPQWPDFKHHFPCDLEPQCQGGEDERRCSYTTEECGLGYLSAKGKCYFALDSDLDLTWLKASEACAARDGHLVSLNSPPEVEEVRQMLLELRPWIALAYVGIQPAGNSFPLMYKTSWLWSDGSIANYVNIAPQPDMTCGAIILHPPPYNSATTTNKSKNNIDITIASNDSGGDADGNHNTRDDIPIPTLTTVHCNSPQRAQVLCEANIIEDAEAEQASSPLSPEEDDQNKKTGDLHSLTAIPESDWTSRLGQGKSLSLSLIRCPSGHMTHKALACDVQAACFSVNFATCSAPLSTMPPMFKCLCADERIPYSSVCDHRTDCQDNSDEDLCVFKACRGGHWFTCASGQQCVARAALCDGQRDCQDGSDEGSPCETPTALPARTPPPPVFLALDRTATLVIDRPRSAALTLGRGRNGTCPPTHVTCWRSSGDCLPVFLRCNGVFDCPGREDEAGCHVATSCPGHYRCRGARVCLHPAQLCDGMFQCPQRDDEAFCAALCPAGCTCYGTTFVCAHAFQVGLYPDVRYLDGGGSALRLENVTGAWYLLHLSLARCGLTLLPQEAGPLPNLRALDLSDNLLEVVPATLLGGLTNLRALVLAGNPLQLFLNQQPSASAAELRVNLVSLDLSRVRITDLSDDTLTSLAGRNLEVLNLSQCGVERVQAAFQRLQNLRVLDLRGCPMTRFPAALLGGLGRLERLHADNYRLCCRGVLPFGFQSQAGCSAPRDPLSSCTALLSSNYYRLFVYTLAAFAVLGNIGSMVYRTCMNRRDSVQPASVFVTHLSAANLLTGLYLLTLAAADWSFRGDYVWRDEAWRNGVACKAAGFIFVLANEVSVFLLCLMTFDRFLALRRPLSDLNFRKWSAHAASLTVWFGALVLAAIPLLPLTAHWRFYGATGLCVPLPVGRGPGGEGGGAGGGSYAFMLFNVFKFVLFLLVAAAQALIFVSVRGARHARVSDKSRKCHDVVLARRLMGMVMTDFLCWFPVGLLGLLAKAGVVLSGDVQVVLALVVLPLNAALNPLLYTLSMARQLKKTTLKEQIREDVLSQARHARLQANEARAVTSATRV